MRFLIRFVETFDGCQETGEDHASFLLPGVLARAGLRDADEPNIVQYRTHDKSYWNTALPCGM